MKFYLQQGYGMMKLNKQFAESYGNIGFILSPRSLNKNQSIDRIKKHIDELRKYDVEILFDPQFYEPRTNLDKILKYPYFSGISYETVEFMGENAKRFSSEVIKYQASNLDVDKFIIPGTFSNNFSEEWVNVQENLVEGALSTGLDKEYYQTISLGSDFVLSENFDDFISICSLSPVHGFYITLKKPDDREYMIKNSAYMYRVLEAFVSLNLAGKKVILGYANQQDLMYIGAGVSGVATGNYQNVRFFDPSIFYDSDEEEIRRRGIWYYDDNTFSEFKPEQLDLAKQRDLFDVFGPENEYNRLLLVSSQASSVKWGESANFKNYLYWMKKHCDEFNSLQANQRILEVKSLFENRRSNIDRLVNRNFKIGSRGFSLEAYEATISALESIEYDRKEDLQELQ